MKKITLLIAFLVCSLNALAQNASIKDSETPSSASINQRITISTEFTNNNIVWTPSFLVYYFLNTTPNLNGNPIPLNLRSNVTGNTRPNTNFDDVRALNPSGFADENHSPYIPDNLNTGTYYIIWSRSNNQVMRSRSIFINGIVPAPDLVVTNASVPNGPFTPGQQINVSARVRNQGTQNAGTSTLEYWISSNTTIGSGDTRLGTDPVQSLSVNQTSTETATLTLPSNRLGRQYIIFRADGSNVINEESNENNNTVALAIDIEESDPDLTMDTQNIMVSGDACTSCNNVLANIGNNRYLFRPGTSARVDIEVQNIGNGPSSGSSILFYLSSNSTLGNTDRQIGENPNVAALGPGQTTTVTVTFFRTDFSPDLGNRFILIVLDRDPDFNDESNEDNNIVPIPIQITNSSSSRPPGGGGIGIVPFFSRLNTSSFGTLSSYPIQVFDLSGQLVTTTMVNGKEEEIQTVKELPQGVYIIKSEHGTRKVFLEE